MSKPTGIIYVETISVVALLLNIGLSDLLKDTAQ